MKDLLPCNDGNATTPSSEKQEGGDTHSTHPPSITNNMTNDNTSDNSEDDDMSTSIESFAQNNPLMSRVQAALRTQLQKTHDRIRQQVLEQDEALRLSKREREDVGVRLYGMQQQLARLQNHLDAVKDRREGVGVERSAKDDALQQSRAREREALGGLEELREAVSRSAAELAGVRETIRQVGRYNDEVEGEIGVTKRAAHKMEETVQNLEKGKKEQDLYIDGLNERIKQLEGDLSLSDSRLERQREKTADAKTMLSETNCELENLSFETKQLVQQWKSSVVALKRRDEALTAATNALREAQSSSKDVKGEADGLKREIAAKTAEKERLVSSREGLESEIAFLEETIGKVRAEQEATSERFEVIQKSILSSNEEEAKITAATTKIQSEINTVNHKIEIVTRERRALEEKIGTTKNEQTTLSKAKRNLLKSEKALLQKIHTKEIEASNIQNELARLKIDTLNTTIHSDQLSSKLNEEVAALAAADDRIEKFETEIRRRNDEIEMKMNKVDRLNRKHEQIMEKANRDEEQSVLLGPLEGVIKSLTSDIASTEEECDDVRRDWLRDQTALVKTVTAVDDVRDKNKEVNATLNILDRKRLRLLGDIGVVEAQVKDVNASVRGMHKDMARLNEIIGKNVKRRLELTNETAIKEKEFVQELKQLEGESVQLEAKIASLKKTKNELLDQMLDVEKQVLQWEKKIKLEKETRDALESSKDVEEMKGMEKEIHRMRHRLETLKREQEKMIRQMERDIYKREDIAVKYQNNKGHRNKPLTAAEVKAKGAEMKRELKKIVKDTDQLNAQIQDGQMQLKDITNQLKKANTIYEANQRESQTLQDDIDEKLFEKQRLLAKLDRHHEMAKKWEVLLEEVEERTKQNDDGDDPPSNLDDDDDEEKSEFEVEKQLALASSKLKRIRNVISGLRIKFRHLDNVFERVECLADDVVQEFRIEDDESLSQ